MLSFEDLPPEIRNEVYHYCLVSPEVIKFRSKKYGGEGEQWPYASQRSYIIFVQPELLPSVLKDLTTGLLRTSRTVAREAAHVFYRNNRFGFYGPYSWRIAVVWLQDIGVCNRTHLTYLGLSVGKLPKSHQWTDSTIEISTNFDLEDFREDAFPRHPLLHFPQGSRPDGRVEDIDPEMEIVFELLGAGVESPAVNIDLYPGFGNLPGPGFARCNGAWIPAYERNDEWFSMDLPNLVEAWRATHGSGCNRRPLNVVWHCNETTKYLDLARTRDQLESSDWDILEVDLHLDRAAPGSASMGSYTTLQMKRRPLRGPIIASDPCPYSAWPESVARAHSEELQEEHEKRAMMDTVEGTLAIRMAAEVVNNRSILDYFQKTERQ